ncbi:D-lyxose/D-mannose family sugar isomerase [Planctomycetota bacterium]
MKRSEINTLQKSAIAFLKEQKCYLPRWAYWTADEWAANRGKTQGVIQNMLGWDITDFGSGEFYKIGLLLFTLRNGNVDNPKGKPYCEKLLIVRERQITPWHFHWNKMEDIINHGGGNLVIEMANVTDDERRADTPVVVQIDEVTTHVDALGRIVLQPGDSVTLPPYNYHCFYGEEGGGTVLVGEVSMVNDDNNDNRFLEPAGRFPEIEEDELLLYYLCNEYPSS